MKEPTGSCRRGLIFPRPGLRLERGAIWPRCGRTRMPSGSGLRITLTGMTLMSWRFPSVVEWTEEAQQERIAVGGPKFIQSFIKERADLLPAAFRIVVFHG